MSKIVSVYLSFIFQAKILLFFLFSLKTQASDTWGVHIIAYTLLKTNNGIFVLFCDLKFFKGILIFLIFQISF